MDYVGIPSRSKTSRGVEYTRMAGALLSNKEVTLRVISLNVAGVERKAARLLDLLLLVDPDVVCLQELWSHDWADETGTTVSSALQRLADYSRSFIRVTHQEGIFGRGMAVWVRYRASTEGSVEVETTDYAQAVKWVTLDGRSVVVVNVHIAARLSYAARKNELRSLADLVRVSDGQRTIMCGDFNAGRGGRSVLTRAVQEGGSLRNFTWAYPPHWTNVVMGTQTEIDHILTISGQWGTVRVSMLPGVSSHAALVADFGIQGTFMPTSARPLRVDRLSAKHKVTVQNNGSCMVLADVHGGSTGVFLRCVRVHRSLCGFYGGQSPERVGYIKTYLRVCCRR